jgi:hypothetical protein
MIIVQFKNVVKLNDSFSKFIEAHIDDYEGKLLKILKLLVLIWLLLIYFECAFDLKK